MGFQYIENRQKILLVFHNRSNYDYHFVIKELANEFKGKFGCFWGKHSKVQNFFYSDKNKK